MKKPIVLTFPVGSGTLSAFFISHLAQYHMNSETIIGLLAAILTTIAYIPRAVKIIRTKHTKNLSLLMYIVLTVGIVLWLVYGLMVSTIPIVLANIAALTLTSIILALKIKYN